MKAPRLLGVWKMGVVNYLEALKLQDELTSNRKIHKITDILLSLQHPPTYTLGKRRTDHNLLVSESELKAMSADLHYTQRGGDVTFHGPHQAILYPIISLREIGLGAREYVGKLESTMIELASLHGVQARAGQKGETGVWVGQRKIGAIGVRISSGITSHGLAFNINPDMNYFKHIVPCGLADTEVTSLQNEVKQTMAMRNIINQRITFVLLYVLVMFLLHPRPCATRLSHGMDNLLASGGRIHSRKLASSVNSLSVNKGKLSGAIVEPEKAVENGLRQRPPSSSNPTQNSRGLP